MLCLYNFKFFYSLYFFQTTYLLIHFFDPFIDVIQSFFRYNIDYSDVILFLLIFLEITFMDSDDLMLTLLILLEDRTTAHRGKGLHTVGTHQFSVLLYVVKFIILL